MHKTCYDVKKEWRRAVFEKRFIQLLSDYPDAVEEKNLSLPFLEISFQLIF